MSLTRYTIIGRDDFRNSTPVFEEADDAGEWVRYADLQALAEDAETVERCAKALYDVSDTLEGHMGVQWAEVVEFNSEFRDYWRMLARAAIRALVPL